MSESVESKLQSVFSPSITLGKLLGEVLAVYRHLKETARPPEGSQVHGPGGRR